MRVRTILAASLLAGTTVALAADSPSLRPGRWEFTMQIDMPQEARGIPGMPFAKPMVDTACVLAEGSDLLAISVPVLAESEGCEMSDYKTTARELSYNAVCDDMTMSLKYVLHTPESVSGHSVSHGKDASQKLSMKFSGKRIGDTCTAKEIAEAKADLEELKAMLKEHG